VVAQAVVVVVVVAGLIAQATDSPDSEGQTGVLTRREVSG
jgi:hypothetical protein